MAEAGDHVSGARRFGGAVVAVLGVAALGVGVAAATTAAAAGVGGAEAGSSAAAIVDARLSPSSDRDISADAAVRATPDAIDPHSIAARADAAWVERTARLTSIPPRALAAYAGAALAVAATSPGCGLGWNTLAGIGWVETHHGTIFAGAITASGRAEPEIIGIPLNGDGTLVIRDTDAGALDGDAVWDRAGGLCSSFRARGRSRESTGAVMESPTPITSMTRRSVLPSTCVVRVVTSQIRSAGSRPSMPTTPTLTTTTRWPSARGSTPRSLRRHQVS